MSFKKARTIAKAFLEPLPKGESWYEERLAICRSCPKNTANIDPEKLTITDKLKIKSGLCDSNSHCTACGCCIERKCATKSENCGLEKIGEEPQWKALSVESEKDPTISVVNLSHTVGEVYKDDKGFVYDFGITDQNKLSFVFDVVRTKKMDIKSYRPGCSCTSVDDLMSVDDNTARFFISVSTLGFRKGWNERKLFIVYTDKGSSSGKELTLTLKVNKPNGK